MRKACTNRACARRISELERQVEDLQGTVRRLLARLGTDSSNSSMPPSSDLARGKDSEKEKGKGKDGKKKKKRRRGGQPGHKGTTRKPFPKDQVDHFIELAPETCCGCGAALDGKSELIDSHQTVDVKPSPVEVTEYRRFVRTCSCGKQTSAKLPKDASPWCLGPRLHAILTTLTGRFRVSRREAEDILVALYGPKARVALGSISAFEKRTSAALEPAHEEALTAIRDSRVRHLDETTWREERKKAWLWVALTKSLTVFRVHRNRSREALDALMGEARNGIYNTDRYAAYHDIDDRSRQMCWSHLKRNFQKLADFGDSAAAAIGHAGLRVHADVMDAYKRHQAGTLKHASMRKTLQWTRRRLKENLKRGRRCEDKDASVLCKELIKHYDALWTFVRYPGVEPTNNPAERALRKAVLWRKGSFGSDSKAGSRFAERMLTVCESLRLQGRTVVDFIEQAIRAMIAGTPAPSLIPALDTG